MRELQRKLDDTELLRKIIRLSAGNQNFFKLILKRKNTLHKLNTVLPVIYSNHLTSKTKKWKFCLQKRVRIKRTKPWTILWQSRVEWLEGQPLGPMNHHEHVINTPGCINNDETIIWQRWWTAMVVKTYIYFSPFHVDPCF